MSRLSLADLEVESFAIQPSESELENIKGGATPAAVGLYVTIVAGVATVAMAIDYFWGDDDESNSSHGSSYGSGYYPYCVPDSARIDSIGANGTQYGISLYY